MKIQPTFTDPQLKSLVKFLQRAQLSGAEAAEFIQLMAILQAAREAALKAPPADAQSA